MKANTDTVLHGGGALAGNYKQAAKFAACRDFKDRLETLLYWIYSPV